MSRNPEAEQALEDELRQLFATVPAPPPAEWVRPAATASARGWRPRWVSHGKWGPEVGLPGSHALPGWAVGSAAERKPPAGPPAGPMPGRHGQGGGWLKHPSARVVLSGLTAVAVAVATFAVLDISLAQHHAPVAGLGPSLSATSSPSATSATSSPAQPVSPASCLLPVAETATLDGSTQFGFLSSATGQFQVDGTAPTPPANSASGYYTDIYVPAMGGWRSVRDGYVVSPSGTSVAYQPSPSGSSTASPSASPDMFSPTPPANVHIIDASGQDRALTPSGEHDWLFGWANQGIVVAHVDVTTNSTTNTDGPLYLVDPASGAERALGIDESSGGTLSVEAVSGDALWYATGNGTASEPWTLIQYDLATGTTTTWFDTQGSPYQAVSIDAVTPQGDPVVAASNATDNYLLLLTQPNKALTIWTGPVESQGFYTQIPEVIADQGWLWFEIELMEPATQTSVTRTPHGQVLLLSATVSGLKAVPDGAGPLAPGSTLTLYWWESSSGSHAVTTMPVSGGSGAGAITVAGSCLSS